MALYGEDQLQQANGSGYTDMVAGFQGPNPGSMGLVVWGISPTCRQGYKTWWRNWGYLEVTNGQTSDALSKFTPDTAINCRM